HTTMARGGRNCTEITRRPGVSVGTTVDPAAPPRRSPPLMSQAWLPLLLSSWMLAAEFPGVGPEFPGFGPDFLGFWDESVRTVLSHGLTPSGGNFRWGPVRSAKSRCAGEAGAGCGPWSSGGPGGGGVGRRWKVVSPARQPLVLAWPLVAGRSGR